MPAKKEKPPEQNPPVIDWRVKTLSLVRTIILKADPNIIEEIKWVKPTNPAGVPVWSCAGIICTGEKYKEVVKLTFANGASLADPHGLFNSSLDGNVRRAIDIRPGEKIAAAHLTELVQSAIVFNQTKTIKPAKSVKLLTGGNPQIAKADGEEPVRVYIAAMPGWKSELGQKLDALIAQSVPEVKKAVKWNSPFYGIEGQGWFVSFHTFTRYVKLAFFKGNLLSPLPPVKSKSPETRYLDIYEDDELDEKQLKAWFQQAAKLPGWVP
jgi:hypothetical protein